MKLSKKIDVEWIVGRFQNGHSKMQIPINENEMTLRVYNRVDVYIWDPTYDQLEVLISTQIDGLMCNILENENR